MTTSTVELVDCTVTSSDETVVLATHEGSRVRVKPVGLGTATVTLFVNNESGEASQSFEVTVVTGAPEIARAATGRVVARGRVGHDLA